MISGEKNLRPKMCKFVIKKIPVILKYTLKYTISIKYKKTVITQIKLWKYFCPSFPGTFTPKENNNALRQFKCTPVKIGQVWHPKKFCLQIQYNWTFGQICQPQSQNFVKKVRNHWNCFTNTFYSKTPYCGGIFGLKTTQIM